MTNDQQQVGPGPSAAGRRGKDTAATEEMRARAKHTLMMTGRVHRRGASSVRENMSPRTAATGSPYHSAVALLCAAFAMLGGCVATEQQSPAAARLPKARALFAAHCQTAGEKIHRTVDNVDGLLLLKVRPDEVNFGDQFKLDDPYGSDFGGDAYIKSFLRGFFRKPSNPTRFTPPHVGYEYVEAADQSDGRRYRYTGRIEEPWQKDKHYLKGYTRFVLDKSPASGPPPRYGVTYDDISTHEDREYWIAGSSLKVIDLQTNQVIAERVGYMMDPRQGDTSGGRSPWLLAANNSCPAFLGAHAASDQLGQAEKFVEKVLRPER